MLDHCAVALSLMSEWFLLMTFRIFGDLLGELLGGSGSNSYLTELQILFQVPCYLHMRKTWT